MKGSRELLCLSDDRERVDGAVKARHVRGQQLAFSQLPFPSSGRIRLIQFLVDREVDRDGLWRWRKPGWWKQTAYGAGVGGRATTLKSFFKSLTRLPSTFQAMSTSPDLSGGDEGGHSAILLYARRLHGGGSAPAVPRLETDVLDSLLGHQPVPTVWPSMSAPLAGAFGRKHEQ